MPASYFVRMPKYLQWIFPATMWRLQGGGKTICLTFDDGPNDQTTIDILDILEERGVKAVFFLLGEQIQLFPELAEEILKRGHQLANHALTHHRGSDFPTPEYIRGVQVTQELLDRYEGDVRGNYFRPPYGQPTTGQYFKLKKLGYKPVMYSLMPGDFDLEISDEECLKRLKTRQRSGDIVVLHDNKKSIERVKKILPEYLDHSLSQGYTFELLP